MIIKNVKQSIKKNKFFTILIIIQLVITILFINNTLFSLGNVISNINNFNFNFKDDTKYFSISDNMDDPDIEKSFFEDKESLYNLKSFYNDIKNSKEYRYLINIFQPIEIINFKGSKEFLYSFERGSTENDIFESNNKKYSRVKNVMVNNNSINEFSFNIKKGRSFNANDFIMNSYEDTIPILIGSDLSKYYNVGDILNGWLYFDNLKFKVVGVLDENSYTLSNEGDIEYLNDYVITPSFEINFESKNKNDYESQVIYYINKVSGLIATEKNTSISNFLTYIDSLRLKYDICEFDLIGINKHSINLLKSVSEQNLNNNIFISTTMILFSTVSLICIFTCKINKNKYIYGVYLLNGASKKNILTFIISEIFLIYFLSLIISFVLNKVIFFEIVNFNLLSIVISFIPIIISIYAAKIKLYRYEIYNLLGRNY